MRGTAAIGRDLLIAHGLRLEFLLRSLDDLVQHFGLDLPHFLLVLLLDHLVYFAQGLPQPRVEVVFHRIVSPA